VYRLIASTVFFACAALASFFAQASTFDQTLSPYTSCARPFTCTFTFSGAVLPGGDGTLSVVGQGDIDSPYEFASVYDEANTFVDYAWDITCPEGWQGSCQDTMTVSLSSLLASWTDGLISFSFVVPAENGLSGVTFQSLRLTYAEASNPPPSEVPAPGTLGLMALGLSALGLARRRSSANT
jgi:hypothetical protein